MIFMVKSPIQRNIPQKLAYTLRLEACMLTKQPQPLTVNCLCLMEKNITAVISFVNVEIYITVVRSISSHYFTMHISSMFDQHFLHVFHCWGCSYSRVQKKKKISNHTLIILQSFFFFFFFGTFHKTFKLATMQFSYR